MAAKDEKDKPPPAPGWYVEHMAGAKLVAGPFATKEEASQDPTAQKIDVRLTEIKPT